MSKKINNSPFNIKDKLAELDAIIDWFESAEVNVDEAVEQYQKGLSLIEELGENLKMAKIKVEKINRKFNIK